MSLTIYTIRELLQQRPPPWLIDKIIPINGLAALYAPPGEGKSFMALDMALSVAAGIHWQGRPTCKGYVVYISAEGGGGLAKRVGAWLEFHHIHDTDHFLSSFVVSAVQLHPESEDIEEVIQKTIGLRDYQAFLAGALDEDEEPPLLFIVVDTLARCFVGDENQQEDMGNFIKGLDYLRQEYQATILVVHHTNKNGYEERGSSAFRGACDTMMHLELTEKGNRLLKCSKQKEDEEFQPIHWDLLPISKWESCVVESTQGRTERLQVAFKKYVSKHPDATQVEIAKEIGISQQTVSRWLGKSKIVSSGLDQ